LLLSEEIIVRGEEFFVQKKDYLSMAVDEQQIWRDWQISGATHRFIPFYRLACFVAQVYCQ
jgi:hypothetical protein